MIIQHNMAAMAAERYNFVNNKNKTKRMERLGSGYRINRAADDAAGLSISEKMRSQIRGLQRASDNVQDGISYAQVADGALSQVDNMLHRMRELAVQSANDTNTAEDRAALDKEVQQLKDEMDRVFKETEFNTLPIWNTDTENRVQIGTEKKQAVKIQKFSSQYTTKVTETNKGAIAYDGYTIKVAGTDPTDAANYGFKIEWKGWDNKDYSTKLISWDEVEVGEKTSFGMNIKDYLDLDNYPATEGIAAQIGWTMEETATIDDVKACIDGVSFRSSMSSGENITLSTSASGVSFGINTDYLAELASGRNVDAYDTDWIEPAGGAGTPNVISYPDYDNPNDSTGWKIQFEMPNIGTVTATSTSSYYYSNDKDAEDEGKWWTWRRDSEGRLYKSTLYKDPSPDDGSLASMTSVISNTNGTSLTQNAESGGQIVLNFDIKPDAGSYTYESRTGTSIGSITMGIAVYDTDTVETLSNRIKSALNSATVVDVYEGSQASGAPSKPSNQFYYDDYYSKEKTHEIDVPVYKATIDLAIQSGANEGEDVHMIYDSLRTQNLGISDSDVLTATAASKTISAAQQALDIVSAQRSLFGAYQNRFEYAMEQDDNAAENLQAAESRIRDTDMASEVQQSAKDTILEQASQAMLANANRQTESVLQLLN